MSGKQTTLDLNGPFLSFITQPVGITTTLSTATLVGIATATFPVQTPTNPAIPSGNIQYRWYTGGIALTDGDFRGATITGTATTTLTLTGLKSPGTSNIDFFLRADYIPSAYGLSGVAITEGTARSTGNPVNTDPLDSNIVTLRVAPNITITSQPESTTVGATSRATFVVGATITDSGFGGLSYQWSVDGQNLTDNGNTIIGANQPTLFFTPLNQGVSTVKVTVSNPNATSVVSNIVNLNSVAPRNIIIIEGFDLQNNYLKQEVNLDIAPYNFTLTDSTFGINFNTITFHASEKNIDAELEIRASKGDDKSSNLGGNGGNSKIRLNLERYTEFTSLGISNNSGMFLYRRSTLMAVVGKGGNAGDGGNGGPGGGIGNPGGAGFGRGAGTGGEYIPNQLSVTGIFGSNSSATTFQSGDSKAAIPNGGRTISCPKGEFWTVQRGIPPCNNLSLTQFYNTNGRLISQSYLINRGFKPGYSITATEGAPLSPAGGAGGSGLFGGNGGNEGGGGGGSGYTDGSFQLLSATVGENNTSKSTINFKIYVPPPIPGCMNSSALNYNPQAQIDDGSCRFPPPPPYVAPPPIPYVPVPYIPPIPYPPIPYCPDPDTLILMSNGTQKRAGDLKIGDYIKNQHENTFEWGDYEVLDAHIIENINKINLIFDETHIICSDTHKMYVDKKGWKYVKDIKIGESVSGYILREVQDYEKGDVISISINEAHTYISNNLLSHNIKGGGGCPDPEMHILMVDGSEKKAGDIEVGDDVLTQHETTLEWGIHKVIHKDIFDAAEKYKMIFASDITTNEIICSTSHKFYVNGKGWTSVSEMILGDIVSDYQLTSLEEIGSGPVVRLTIDNAHTYICNNLLSHNKLVIPTPYIPPPIPPIPPPIPPIPIPIPIPPRGRTQRGWRF